uniref:Uncharacterized protein n=1 Tax=Romanomermis culicivorax TaxID=13658 RepID=A0A915I8S3_ROMCU
MQMGVWEASGPKSLHVFRSKKNRRYDLVPSPKGSQNSPIGARSKIARKYKPPRKIFPTMIGI